MMQGNFSEEFLLSLGFEKSEGPGLMSEKVTAIVLNPDGPVGIRLAMRLAEEQEKQKKPDIAEFI